MPLHPQLDGFAQRLASRATWSDVALPPRETAQLREVVKKLRQSRTGRWWWPFAWPPRPKGGLAALIAGGSAADKIVAAEALANEAKLSLYRVDLSRVVSKYIGETEKNLHRLFDAAEDAGAILLFDEADALFGKRTDVKDSHDRYANIELSYLMQRVEAYGGLTILTTAKLPDPKFLSRFDYVVDFSAGHNPAEVDKR